ncbi:aldehyde dehydrogenase family protein [Saccharopolyspora elongata]|uniref:aldehyde dehydrogenase family protein n=1 Tax=Saccharopolyspora elongata TaxID=2530387 RepID=UPI001F1F3F43|nr:aldehyde dehydrogenase family protein [Saccharopolyspora elongata]
MSSRPRAAHSPCQTESPAFVRFGEPEQSAVRAARRALANGWADTAVRERAALLRRAADRIEERFEEFVAAEVADTGKPVTQVWARSLACSGEPESLIWRYQACTLTVGPHDKATRTWPTAPEGTT